MASKVELATPKLGEGVSGVVALGRKLIAATKGKVRKSPAEKLFAVKMSPESKSLEREYRVNRRL